VWLELFPDHIEYFKLLYVGKGGDRKILILSSSKKEHVHHQTHADIEHKEFVYKRRNLHHKWGPWVALYHNLAHPLCTV
jgi:hypothetical protein